MGKVSGTEGWRDTSGETDREMGLGVVIVFGSNKEASCTPEFTFAA